MKKSLLLIAILLGLFLTVHAQCPETADITLDSQDKIDNFIILYPNCTTIDGYLTIDENVDGDITNLDGLRNIKYIGKGLTIRNNSSLKSVSGLETLDSIGEGLRISNNKSLETLDGLSGLKKINSNLEISENGKLMSIKGFGDATLTCIGGGLVLALDTSLTSLEGLESIKTIKRSLSLGGMNSLTNLNGFNNITSIGECLIVQSNTKLQDFTGLNKLDTIGGYVEILSNSALKDFSGLSSLISTGGYIKVYGNNSLLNFSGLSSLSIIGKVSDDLRNQLVVYGNPSLTNFSGLETLNQINGDLYVSDNQSLLNLAGLQNLTAIKGSIYLVRNDKLNDIAGIKNIDPKTVNANNSSYKDLQISENPQLSECAIQCICATINDDDKSKTIQNNKTGCNYISEIKAACYTSGIHDETEYLVKLYPNPAKESLYLKFNEASNINLNNFNIEIYSTTGQKVKIINHQVDKIDISNLSEGIYIVNIITGKDVVSRKIAIAK